MTCHSTQVLQHARLGDVCSGFVPDAGIASPGIVLVVKDGRTVVWSSRVVFKFGAHQHGLERTY